MTSQKTQIHFSMIINTGGCQKTHMKHGLNIHWQPLTLITIDSPLMK